MRSAQSPSLETGSTSSPLERYRYPDFQSLKFIVIMPVSVVDPNPKESESFGWIRIQKKSSDSDMDSDSDPDTVVE
jgi:hypothetical protein